MIVVATKWARHGDDLSHIEIEMVEITDGVRVTTTNPQMLAGVSVDLEITVPEDTRPTLHNGAGGIVYEGEAQGNCRFETGAGSITLKLPVDIDVEVYLSVGAGTIVVDFPVNGHVSQHLVDGVIGTGAKGRIVATVGAGTINVYRQ